MKTSCKSAYIQAETSNFTFAGKLLLCIKGIHRISFKYGIWKAVPDVNNL